MRNIVVAFGIIALVAVSFDASAEPVNDLTSRATAALNEAEYQKAADLYTTVLKENPDDREARIKRGLCYTKLNQPQNAESDFKELCAVNPRDYEARYALGNTYFTGKRYKEAFIVFDELAQINPEQLSLLAAAHSAFACRMYGTAAKYYKDARGLTEDLALLAQIDLFLKEAASLRPGEDKRRAIRQAEQQDQERFLTVNREQAARNIAASLSAMDAQLTKQLATKNERLMVVKHSSLNSSSVAGASSSGAAPSSSGKT